MPVPPACYRWEQTRESASSRPPTAPAAATVETVHQRKGADLFTARFAARFNQA